MRRLLFSTWLPCLVLLVAGCGSSEPSRDPATGLSEQRQILSQGYSMLYQDASRLGAAGLVLLVKFESDEVDALVTDLGHYASRLSEELEQVSRDYPGVRIDLDPLPEMEKRKRFAIGLDRAIKFAPFRGSSQMEYERTLLISISNGLNHERHLCRVMSSEEPDAGLKKILGACAQGYDGFYQRVMRLLERDYFRAAGEIAATSSSPPQESKRPDR